MYSQKDKITSHWFI